MDRPPINTDKIISRLKFFRYKYEIDGTSLKILLPMVCYLKIDFAKERIKMTSRIWFGFRFLTLEYNFVIYGFGLYILAWYQWAILNKAIFIFLGLIIIHFVVCFIKIETMKIIIHNWIEVDS